MGSVSVGAVGSELLTLEMSALGQRCHKALVLSPLEQCAPLALKLSALELLALRLSKLKQLDR